MTATACLSAGTAFDLWAEVYDAECNPVRSLAEASLADILPNLNGKHVLDCGCGTGSLFSLLRSRGAARVYGVDPSREMARRAQALGLAEVSVARGEAMPLPQNSVDWCIASLILSYVEDLHAFAAESARVCRPGATLVLLDMHPETASRRGWKRGFTYQGSHIEVPCFTRTVSEVVTAFEAAGWKSDDITEIPFSVAQRQMFLQAGRGAQFTDLEHEPVLYAVRLTLASGTHAQCEPSSEIAFSGTRLPFPGTMILPGLINAHDHLDFALFPRLGDGPYRNTKEWAADIHSRHAAEIARHREVPREDRHLWGALRNLLCGVTIVCNHNPLTPDLRSPLFPLRVVQQFRWAHSFSFQKDMVAAAGAGSAAHPFVLHLGEGVDEVARSEFLQLKEAQLLNRKAVLVHALALSEAELHEVAESGAGLILCPSSNAFLFDSTPMAAAFEHKRMAIGSDSPLTACGDLLDEVRFAHVNCKVAPAALYASVTRAAADILNLPTPPSSPSDFILLRTTVAFRDHALLHACWRDVSLVVIRDKVVVADAEAYRQLPSELTRDLQQLFVDEEERWVRLPLQRMFTQTRCVQVEPGLVRMQSRSFRLGGR